jgi:hypothetical protein
VLDVICTIDCRLTPSDDQRHDKDGVKVLDLWVRTGAMLMIRSVITFLSLMLTRIFAAEEILQE